MYTRRRRSARSRQDYKAGCRGGGESFKSPIRHANKGLDGRLSRGAAINKGFERQRMPGWRASGQEPIRTYSHAGMVGIIGGGEARRNVSTPEDEDDIRKTAADPPHHLPTVLMVEVFAFGFTIREFRLFVRPYLRGAVLCCDPSTHMCSYLHSLDIDPSMNEMKR